MTLEGKRPGVESLDRGLRHLSLEGPGTVGFGTAGSEEGIVLPRTASPGRWVRRSLCHAPAASVCPARARSLAGPT